MEKKYTMDKKEKENHTTKGKKNLKKNQTIEYIENASPIGSIN